MKLYSSDNHYSTAPKIAKVLRFINVCPEFSGHLEKRLEKKAKIFFKIYEVIEWETNNHDTHTTQYLQK